jgi:uncharacterized protein
LSSLEKPLAASPAVAPSPPSRWRRVLPPTLAVLLLGLIWLASDLAVPAALAPWTGRLQGFVTIFLGIFIEALPFLMAGVLVSSVIHLYVTPETVQRLAPRNPLAAALAGSLLGLAFPVCECGSIPATRRLLRKGASIPAGIAFALAAPVINPIVLIATFVAFGSWQMVAWRAGLTIVIAVIVALVIGVTPRRDLVLARGVDAQDDHSACDHEHGACDHDHDQSGAPQDALSRVLGHASSEFFEMNRYLVAGAMLAAALQTLVPQQSLMALGSGPLLSVLVMIALAVLLSICSTVDSFIALAFVNTFTPGAIIAFLVFGPMIDIKSTLLLTTTFRRRAVALIVLLCFQLALLAGLAFNLFGLGWG